MVFGGWSCCWATKVRRSGDATERRTQCMSWYPRCRRCPAAEGRRAPAPRCLPQSSYRRDHRWAPAAVRFPPVRAQSCRRPAGLRSPASVPSLGHTGLLGLGRSSPGHAGRPASHSRRRSRRCETPRPGPCHHDSSLPRTPARPSPRPARAPHPAPLPPLPGRGWRRRPVAARAGSAFVLACSSVPGHRRAHARTLATGGPRTHSSVSSAFRSRARARDKRMRSTPRETPSAVAASFGVKPSRSTSSTAARSSADS